jgi:hypothetical protein
MRYGTHSAGVGRHATPVRGQWMKLQCGVQSLACRVFDELLAGHTPPHTRTGPLTLVLSRTRPDGRPISNWGKFSAPNVTTDEEGRVLGLL